jgi:ribosome maturation factor RimP
MSRAQASPVVDRVHSLVAPIVNDLGLDLYDLDYVGGVLRVVVDTPPGGESGVSLDTIALITRLVSRDLDHQDPVPGRYTLEVSSPGLERVLREPRHYQREIGKDVSVKLSEPIAGTRRLQGTLIAATDHDVVVRDADLVEHTVAYAAIEKTKTVFQWESAPKPGSKKSKGVKAS